MLNVQSTFLDMDQATRRYGELAAEGLVAGVMIEKSAQRPACLVSSHAQPAPRNDA